jgi:hypothetical protein
LAGDEIYIRHDLEVKPLGVVGGLTRPTRNPTGVTHVTLEQLVRCHGGSVQALHDEVCGAIGLYRLGQPFSAKAEEQVAIEVEVTAGSDCPAWLAAHGVYLRA